jgi:hypothetical protein
MQDSRFLFADTWATCLISPGLSEETSQPDSPCRQFSRLDSGGAELAFDLGWDWGAAQALMHPSRHKTRVRRTGIVTSFSQISFFVMKFAGTGTT